MKLVDELEQARQVIETMWKRSTNGKRRMRYRELSDRLQRRIERVQDVGRFDRDTACITVIRAFDGVAGDLPLGASQTPDLGPAPQTSDDPPTR